MDNPSSGPPADKKPEPQLGESVFNKLPDPIPAGPPPTPPPFSKDQPEPAKPNNNLKKAGLVAAILFLVITVGVSATLLLKKQKPADRNCGLVVSEW